MQKERGEGLPRRPAAGEDGDRRGRRRGGRSAARRCTPARRGLADYLAVDELDALRIGREHRGAPQLAQARPGARSRRRDAAAATTPRSCSASRRADVRVPVRRPRGARPDRRRLPVRGVQAALRHHSSSPAGRSSTATRSGSSPTTASCSARSRRRARSSSSCATGTTPRSCSCRTSPASWSAPATSRAASSRTAPSSSTPCRNSTVPHLTLMVGASLRRRQLRHVRAGVRPAVRLHLAEPPHRGDGPEAARRRDGRSWPGRRPRSRACRATRRRSPPMRDGLSRTQIERESTALFATGRRLGRRHHRPARHPHRAGHRAVGGPHQRGRGHANFGVFRM